MFLCSCHVSHRDWWWHWLSFEEKRSRTQNSTKGLKVGPRANGVASTHSWRPNLLKPIKCEEWPRKPNEILWLIKAQRQWWNKVFHYFMSKSDLEHDNFNQSTQNHAFFTFLLTSSAKQKLLVMNLLRQKKLT